jgi:transcriptional regulator with PAS, ATPase and Fis domain
MVAAGTFREDLFYRVNVINVELPPLRDRRDDVSVLLEHFLARHRRNGRPKRLAADCLAQMLAYPWPGNVRELENEIERLVVLAGDAAIIEPSLLSPRIRQYTPPLAEPPPRDEGSLPAAIEALERRMIRSALDRHGGNKTRAAEELKVSRRNLIRLVQKYQLET